MAEAVEQVCGERPGTVLADAGYYAMGQIQAVEQRGVTVYVPDRLMATELAGMGMAREMNRRQRQRTPGLHELRERLREPEGRRCYARRKALVEPVIGVLKHQRGMRKFRLRGLTAVGSEWALTTTGFNLTRMFRVWQTA